MPDAVDKPVDVSGENAPQGFSCPGITFLPGLMAALSFHLSALSLGMYRTVQVGPSWATVGLVVAVIGGFWVMFLSVACVFGVRGAVNLLGFASAILCFAGVIVGLVGGLIWLVWWWVATAL